MKYVTVQLTEGEWANIQAKRLEQGILEALMDEADADMLAAADAALVDSFLAQVDADEAADAWADSVLDAE
jgi:hypothetical protein